MEIHLPVFLTEKDIAGRLNVSLSSVRNWRAKRSGPPTVYVGKSVRYPVDGFSNWLTTLSKGVGQS